MKKRALRIMIILLTGSLPFLPSCSKKEEPKVQGPPSESLGREMGETMHGAINQAKEVRDELSQRAQQTLDEMKGEEKRETDPFKILEGPTTSDK